MVPSPASLSQILADLAHMLRAPVRDDTTGRRPRPAVNPDAHGQTGRAGVGACVRE